LRSPRGERFYRSDQSPYDNQRTTPRSSAFHDVTAILGVASSQLSSSLFSPFLPPPFFLFFFSPFFFFFFFFFFPHNTALPSRYTSPPLAQTNAVVESPANSPMEGVSGSPSFTLVCLSGWLLSWGSQPLLVKRYTNHDTEMHQLFMRAKLRP